MRIAEEAPADRTKWQSEATPRSTGAGQDAVLNKTTVINKDRLVKLLERTDGRHLITFSNHDSCFGEPGLWGVLPFRHLWSRKVMRWSTAAHDVCFTTPLHTYFFSLGKCLPIIRGGGVYQEGIDYSIDRLNEGDWVHIFPEGKVNGDKKHIRLKWGVGRMIMECKEEPLVLPLFHTDMEEVLPNQAPYRLKFGKNVVFNVGELINFSDLRRMNADIIVKRKIITDRVQEHFYKLKAETYSLREEIRSSGATS
ncbi:tafazzin-like [Artemia franciscana]|uniref:tafazzin-like n=1 Tax=Artemia franciscana TaxID=6661 RepID=UPI0032DA3EAF